MKLISDASVLRLTHEGIDKFESLSDFDKKSIHHLPSTCKDSIPAIDAYTSNNVGANAFFAGESTSSISVSRLITSVNDEK